MQFHTLKNFVNGHGISLTSLDANNNVVYLPCSLWPAGLVIFLSPVYFITKSAVLSGLILKLIGNIFFILFLSKYFNYLNLENYIRKFIIIFLIIAVAPFVEFYVSDLIATVFCLWGFYFNLQYQDTGKYRHLLLSVIFIGVSYFIKYSFLPFLLYPAVSFILKERWAIFNKLKELLVIVFFTTIAYFLFYYLNKMLVGDMQMQSAFDAFNGNPHWFQLERFDGFLFTFGIYEWVFENFIRGLTGGSIHFNWISLLATLYFYILFVKTFFTKSNTARAPVFKNSLNISLSAGILIMGFLAFLTLNNPGQTWTKPYWTFVQETRYYGPVIIIGLLNLIILFFYKKEASFLHILVPVMMVLNLYAYRTVIQSGFWGKDYQHYSKVKENISTQLELNNNGNLPVVYYDKNVKSSDEYYYLQSEGTILLDKSRLAEDSKSSKINYYVLKMDSSNRVALLRKFN